MQHQDKPDSDISSHQLIQDRKLFIFISFLTDSHPAEAPGVMSLRKGEGPLGTVDLPVPEAAPGKVRELEAGLALERKLEMVCSLR